MKKVLFVAFMVMAFVALGSLAAFACGEHSTTAKKADASTISAKQASATTTTAAGCCASKASTANATTTNATLASSKTTTNGATCSVADKAACLAKGTSLTTAMVCSPENIAACIKFCEAKHAEICGLEASKAHHLTSMSIKGMTCPDCEGKVRTALMAVEGVNNVLDVCSKAGFAVVCVKDGAKLNNESMIKAVSSKGFQSEIIPAVSVTTTITNTTEKAECSAHKKDGSK